jgi:hypothetical protein
MDCCLWLILRVRPCIAHTQNFRVFHNSIHRYFVFAPRIALTPLKQLFSLFDVDG